MGCAKRAGEMQHPQGGWDAAAGEDGTSLLKTSEAARAALAGAVEGRSRGEEVQEAEGAAALHALEVWLRPGLDLLLLTAHCSLLTAHCSLLTAHY